MAKAAEISDTPERKLIEPGWYKDLPNESYHRSNGSSSSNLKTLLPKTAEHLLYEKTHPKPSTANMALGTAVHSLVLETDKFDEDIAVMPDYEGRGSTALKNAFKSQHEGKTIISSTQHIEALAMAQRVKDHPIASILVDDVICESSIYWWYKSMDPDDNTHYKELLKVRPDGISRKHPVIVDLKTTRDGSYSGFNHSILDYYYHVSAAMYLEGVNQCKPLLEETGFFAYTKFVFVCVENTPPYSVSVYELSPEYLELGKYLYRMAVQRLQHGRENDWPGYPEEVRLIEPPSWASRLWIV